MIQARNLSVRVGGFHLEEINFAVAPGDYCVLMGRTGSGKTTLLETICGLKQVTGGQILLGERDVTHLKPSQRQIGYVPQDGALFHTMTAREHLEFALRIRHWPRKKIDDRVDHLAELLGLTEMLGRRPFQLSGGERQRVALGRALSFEPHILCLDEPLSALDDETRNEIIHLLKRVQREVGVTAPHVTHNRHEAEELADYHLVIVDGRVMERSLTNGHAPPTPEPAEEAQPKA